jgi:tripartite-type tricarboxylate transporter receptor subunit TctC
LCHFPRKGRKTPRGVQTSQTGAPAGTPQPIIDALNKGILEVLAMPETKKQLLDLGIEAKGSTPAELGDKLKADIAKWTAIIDKSGIEKQ